MAQYSTHGCGHRILARIEPGPLFFADLIEVAKHRRRPRDHARHTLEALKRDGFVRLTAQGYAITEDGRAKLDDLDDAATPTSVKVYGARVGA
jgi:hypothetical protein